MIWIISGIFAVMIIILLLYVRAVKKELRSIADDLDRTLERTDNSLVKIALFDKDINYLTSAINRNISNQKRLKLEAERAENTLKRSVSDIAHDLRTPLSVVYGELQLMERQDCDEKMREYISICLEKTAAMKKISDEFFELAVLESDTGKVRVGEVNITNLLMAFIAENEGVIRMTGLEPQISFPPKTVTALADETLLSRMFGNLLSNILKYSAKSF